MAKVSILKEKSNKKLKTQAIGFKIEKCKIYSVVRVLMRIGRWFGFFPVEGLNLSSISGLKFRIKSFYGLYLFLSFIGQIMMTLVKFWGLLESVSLTMFYHFFFYAASLVSLIFFVILAKNWQLMIKDIAHIEEKLTDNLDHTTSRNIFVMQFLVILFGAVEHGLCFIYVINFAMKCLKNFSLSYPVIYMLFTLKLNFVLDVTSPNYWNFVAGLVLEFPNAQAKFMQILMDVFVMSQAIYLTANFIAFNKKIEAEKNNVLTNWGELRLQHSHLVNLVKKIDEQLSPFILMSFSLNLFFTVYQLFNSLRIQEYEFGICDSVGALQAMTGNIHTVYYVFSFMFLVTRTICMSLLTANVNAHANQPVWALGEVHASKYNMEIQRFYRQITYTTIGVSGIFFIVTREMILKVVGTLITYELVLLQFNNVNTTVNYTATINSSLATNSRKLTFNY